MADCDKEEKSVPLYVDPDTRAKVKARAAENKRKIGDEVAAMLADAEFIDAARLVRAKAETP